MMLAGRPEPDTSNTTSVVIIIILVLVMGATVYLAKERYIRRKNAIIAIGLVLLCIVAVGFWMHQHTLSLPN